MTEEHGLENKEIHQEQRAISLSSMKPGQKGTVAGVKESGGVSRRLLEMGIVPGVAIKFVKTAPFGDPCEVRVLDCNLAIRKREAELIEVFLEELPIAFS
ncbi:MAG TPA: ferrous iron transport protein A [Pyrinomonadaceae bacterium]|nr:ferrous iron transport protein A [Pyrinomonadaceae bacterium]